MDTDIMECLSKYAMQVEKTIAVDELVGSESMRLKKKTERIFSHKSNISFKTYLHFEHDAFINNGSYCFISNALGPTTSV